MNRRSAATEAELVTTTDGLSPNESGLGRGTEPTTNPVLALNTCTPLSPAAMNAFPPASSTVDLDSAMSAPLKGNVPTGASVVSLNTEICPGVPCTTTICPPATVTHRASCRRMVSSGVRVTGSMTNSAPVLPDVAYALVPEAVTLVATELANPLR